MHQMDGIKYEYSIEPLRTKRKYFKTKIIISKVIYGDIFMLELSSNIRTKFR